MTHWDKKSKKFIEIKGTSAGKLIRNERYALFLPRGFLLLLKIGDRPVLPYLPLSLFAVQGREASLDQTERSTSALFFLQIFTQPFCANSNNSGQLISKKNIKKGKLYSDWATKNRKEIGREGEEESANSAVLYKEEKSRRGKWKTQPERVRKQQRLANLLSEGKE